MKLTPGLYFRPKAETGQNVMISFFLFVQKGFAASLFCMFLLTVDS